MKQGSFKVAVAVALIVATAGLAVLMVYLFRQGLAKASEWATFLVLPVSVITAVAGVWAVVLAVQALRSKAEESEQGHSRPVASGPTITRSGNIRQDHNAGSAVAHSGIGDIIFTRPEVAGPLEGSDEPRSSAN